jgi:hypothetical protein
VFDGSEGFTFAGVAPSGGTLTFPPGVTTRMLVFELHKGATDYFSLEIKLTDAVNASISDDTGQITASLTSPAFETIINLDGKANAGSTSAVGITVSGLDPAKSYDLSLPPGQTYVAWSTWSSDAGATDPTHPWHNRFSVTTVDGTTEYGSYSVGTTPDDARSQFPGATITGYSSYTFWLNDSASSDNRGGLSIKVEEASP